MTRYEMDGDTTVEPYIRTLLVYLNKLGVEVRYWSTCWEEELPDAKMFQRIFRFLGERNIFPFLYWGPHLVVHGVKL